MYASAGTVARAAWLATSSGTPNSTPLAYRAWQYLQQDVRRYRSDTDGVLVVSCDGMIHALVDSRPMQGCMSRTIA
jgi:hypothetical protein